MARVMGRQRRSGPKRVNSFAKPFSDMVNPSLAHSRRERKEKRQTLASTHGPYYHKTKRIHRPLEFCEDEEHAHPSVRLSDNRRLQWTIRRDRPGEEAVRR